MSNIAIINDNNNFAPSIFQSLCEFVGDCFGPQYFSSGSYAPSEKYLSPKQSPPISHNDLKKDGAQLLLCKYYLFLDVENLCLYDVYCNYSCEIHCKYISLQRNLRTWTSFYY